MVPITSLNLLILSRRVPSLSMYNPKLVWRTRWATLGYTSDSAWIGSLPTVFRAGNWIPRLLIVN